MEICRAPSEVNKKMNVPKKLGDEELKNTTIISTTNNNEEEEDDDDEEEEDEESEIQRKKKFQGADVVNTPSILENGHDKTFAHQESYSLPTGIFVNNQNAVLYYPKPFYCDLCKKYFGTKGSLKTHLRVHTGEKPFVCPVPNCGRSFTQQANCSRHIKLMHHDKNLKLRPQRRQEDGTLKESEERNVNSDGNEEEEEITPKETTSTIPKESTSFTPKATKPIATKIKDTATDSDELRKKKKVEIIAPNIIPPSAQQLPPQAYYQQISPSSIPMSFPPQTTGPHSQFLYSQPIYDSNAFLTVFHRPMYPQQVGVSVNETGSSQINVTTAAAPYPLIPPPHITTPPPELNGAMKCLMKLCEEEREKTIISAQQNYYPSKQ